MAQVEARVAENAEATAQAEVKTVEKEIKLLEGQAKKEKDPEVKAEVTTHLQALKRELPAAKSMWQKAVDTLRSKKQESDKASIEAQKTKDVAVAQIILENKAIEAEANGDVTAMVEIAQTSAALATGKIEPEPVTGDVISKASVDLIRVMRDTGAYWILFLIIENYLKETPNYTTSQVDDMLVRIVLCAPKRLEKSLNIAHHPKPGSILDPEYERQIKDIFDIISNRDDRSSPCPEKYKNILDQADDYMVKLHNTASDLGEYIQFKFGNYDPKQANFIDPSLDKYPVFDEFMRYAREQYGTHMTVRVVLLALVVYISKSYDSQPPIDEHGYLGTRPPIAEHNTEPLRLLRIPVESNLATRITQKSYPDDGNSILAEAFLRYLHTRVAPETFIDCPYTWHADKAHPYFRELDRDFWKYPPKKPPNYKLKYTTKECNTLYQDNRGAGWAPGQSNSGYIDAAKKTVADMLLASTPALYRYVAVKHDKGNTGYTSSNADIAREFIIEMCMYPVDEMEKSPAVAVFQPKDGADQATLIAALRTASTGFVFTPEHWQKHHMFWSEWFSADYPNAIQPPYCGDFSGKPGKFNDGLDKEHREAICRGDPRCTWTPGWPGRSGLCSDTLSEEQQEAARQAKEEEEEVDISRAWT